MSDSDSDVPLGELLKRKAAEKPVVVKKSKPEKKEDPKPKPRSSSSSSTPKKGAAAVPSARSGSVKNDMDVFYETTKGQLMQKLICR